jgi:serine protease Do
LISRAALVFFFAAFTPSSKQNLAITEDGGIVCGSVLLSEHLVLTAAHCIADDAGTPLVYAEVRCGSLDQPAEVMAADMAGDLALLRMLLPCDDAAQTKLAASDPLVGSEVTAIGYPRKRARVSRGIVSGYETSEIPPHGKHPVLVSDTKIYFGNSGGGLFNTRGELVGIASQLDQAGYGYWIPVSSIHKFLDGI